MGGTWKVRAMKPRRGFYEPGIQSGGDQEVSTALRYSGNPGDNPRISVPCRVLCDGRRVLGSHKIGTALICAGGDENKFLVLLSPQ